MIGSSIALSISEIPFMGPTGSVIVGYVDGEYASKSTPSGKKSTPSLGSLAIVALTITTVSRSIPTICIPKEACSSW